MAHEISFVNNVVGDFAYREQGGAPWHRLGTPMEESIPLEVWAEKAGMTWTPEEAPALYYDEAADSVEVFEGRKIILRSDTRQPLCMVGSNFQVVKPIDVIDTMRKVLDLGGYRMETAGCLFGGKRFFATAKIDRSLTLKGRDYIEGYVLLATALDGTMSTTGIVSTLRTVCNNTLTANLGSADSGNVPYIKIPHSVEFDKDYMLQQLGLIDGAWSRFCDDAEVLASRKVTDEEAMAWMVKVLGDPNKSMDEQPHQKAMAKIIQLFKGEGKGSDLNSAAGTAWGLVNALTEFSDHHRLTKTDDARFDSSQFGTWARIKADGYSEALKLAA